MSVIKVDQIQGSTGTTVTIPSGTTIVNSGTATNFGISDTNSSASGLVKHWININGNPGATPAVRASFNSSGITDNGTGDFTVTYTNNLADADASVQTTHNSKNSQNDYNSCYLYHGTIPTTSTYRVATSNQSGTKHDSMYIAGLTGGEMA